MRIIHDAVAVLFFVIYWYHDWMICGWERISTHRASQSMVPKEFCLLGNEIRTQNYIAINTIDIRVNQYSVKRNYEALWQKAKHSQFHIAGLTGYFCIQKKKKKNMKNHWVPLDPRSQVKRTTRCWWFPRTGKKPRSEKNAARQRFQQYDYSISHKKKQWILWLHGYLTNYANEYYDWICI